MLNEVGVVAVLTLLLTVSQKWTAMDPLRIEDGPSWPWAFVGAAVPMVCVVLSLVLRESDRVHIAAVFASYAFGAGIAPCFLTQFKSREEGDGRLLTWWKSKLNGFADGAFKALIIWVLGTIVSLFIKVDAGYWLSLLLAIGLLLSRMAIAIDQLHDENSAHLMASRMRMLIGGNVIITFLLGTSCLIIWAFVLRGIERSLPHVLLQDYQTAIAFVLGVGIHAY
jgi:hypothetical protein